jgi:hypothetical protein
MARFWYGFHVTCGRCGHRNRPSKSPREGIRMALLGQIPPCRGCGKELHPTLKDRPLLRKVRTELEREGLLPPAPADDHPLS